MAHSKFHIWLRKIVSNECRTNCQQANVRFYIVSNDSSKSSKKINGNTDTLNLCTDTIMLTRKKIRKQKRRGHHK